MRLFVSLLLFVIWVIMTPLGVNAFSNKPKPAFQSYPLKGTLNSSLFVSKDPASKARWKVSRPFQSICKSKTIVLDYPPRYKPERGSKGTWSEVRINNIIDAWDLANPSANSSNYVSADIVCGDYRFFYYHWLSQGQKPALTTIADVYLYAISEARRSVNLGGMFQDAVWCRSPVVGVSNHMEYDSAIFKISDSRVVYFQSFWRDHSYNICTKSWSEVQQWQRQGWYLIQ